MGKVNDQFKPSLSNYMYFGYTNDSIWLKLDLEKVGPRLEEEYWLESIDKLSHLEAYFVRDDGTYSLDRRGVYHLEEQPCSLSSLSFPYDRS